jgi:hypothetical protein
MHCPSSYEQASQCLRDGMNKETQGVEPVQSVGQLCFFCVVVSCIAFFSNQHHLFLFSSERGIGVGRMCVLL